MALKALIQKQVKKAFEKQLGDLAESITYKKEAGVSYNASTGVSSRTFTTATGVKAVLAGYKAHELAFSEGAVLSTDLKCLIAQGSLSGVTPEQHDQVVRADGTTWEVMSVAQDPAQALWTLQLRRP